jgi:CRISPR/Cas system-associated endonuclease/helicase Cas3
LVILNTIDDTKDLYSLLSTDFKDSELILLNTHFTPRDRNLKIYLAKRRLKEEKKIIVISTQLIEAGVDIDFPVLYRDFATVASIVQSAGRCNRNGKFATKGKVFLFKLSNKNKIRSELIYRGIDRDLLSRFTTNAFDKSTYEEKELLLVQRVFFNYIQNELHFAKHWKKGNNNLQNPDFDFIKDIKQCMYDKIGKFQLIDKQEYGEERQYFIPRKANDNRFELLLFKEEELMELFRRKESISKIKIKKREIESQLKKMANDIVQIRLKGNQQQPLLGSERSYFDLFKINKTFYSFKEGINLNGNEYIL